MNSSHHMRSVENPPIISRIENLNTVTLGSTRKLVGIEMRRLRHATRDSDAIAVDALHRSEVKRRIRLTRQYFLDECRVIAEGQFERAIEPALIAECARRYGSEGLAACAARPVARKQLQVVVKEILDDLSRTLEAARADASIVPFWATADSRRSGRPTSPTKTKSPVTSTIGLSAPLPNQ